MDWRVAGTPVTAPPAQSAGNAGLTGEPERHLRRLRVRARAVPAPHRAHRPLPAAGAAAGPAASSATEDCMPIPHRDGPNAGSAVLAPPELASGLDTLPLARCRELLRIMVRTRVMDERCIKMSKSGEAFFWVGGPGEEAFNACLGLQVKKGEGPAYDYLHLHYRNAAVMVAMGMPLIDHVRQMAMARTDPFSMGRNFVCHYAKKEWNVLPVTSVIEVQYVMAPGTALMQKRFDGDGVSVVVGGDAGTAEGDFASCMIWSTRPRNE